MVIWERGIDRDEFPLAKGYRLVRLHAHLGLVDMALLHEGEPTGKAWEGITRAQSSYIAFDLVKEIGLPCQN